MINHLRNGDSTGGYSRAWKVMGLERDITALFFFPFFWDMAMKNGSGSGGWLFSLFYLFWRYEFGESWNIIVLVILFHCVKMPQKYRTSQVWGAPF